VRGVAEQVPFHQQHRDSFCPVLRNWDIFQLYRRLAQIRRTSCIA
jgi:hypothetical protein